MPDIGAGVCHGLLAAYLEVGKTGPELADHLLRLEDAPRLHHWSNWIQRQFDAASLVTERELIEEAVGEFYAYEDELIARRRRTPGEDLISALIQAESEGDRLNDEGRIRDGSQFHQPHSVAVIPTPRGYPAQTPDR